VGMLKRGEKVHP